MEKAVYQKSLRGLRQPGLQLLPLPIVLFFYCLIFISPDLQAQSQNSDTTATNTAKVELGIETFDAVWKIINETHFDPQFGGVDWEQVRNELRPKAEAAQDMAGIRKVVMEMLGRLKESHMYLLPREKSAAYQKEEKSKAGDGGIAKPSKWQQASSSAVIDRGAWRLLTLRQPKAAIASSTNKTSVFSQSRSTTGDAGFEVRLLMNECIISRVDPAGPAALAKMKPGWKLLAIDGTPVEEVFEWIETTHLKERDRVTGWSMIHKALLGPVGSIVKLELQTEKKRRIAAEITRRSIPGEPVKFGLIPTIYANFHKEILQRGQNKKIGLMQYNIWMLPVSKDIDAAVDEMRTMDGIIIDLRGNLGGVMGMLMGVSGHFFNDPAILGTMKMRQAELKLAANPRLVNAAGKRVVPYQGPLAILVDEISLSASEVFAGGMQDLGRARVFGEKTTGQALPAIFDRLPNGDTLMHAMGDYITHSGKRLEGKGVVPNHVIGLDPRSLASGKDTVLEAAVEWILAQKTVTGVK